MAIANWTCVSWVAYAPGNIAVNVTRCKTPRCIYPSIFNRFQVIQAWSLKIHQFSTFFAHFGLPCVRPWDNHGKCHTVGKRIQFNTFTSIHLPRLSEGRTQRRPKCAKNVLKWRIFKLPVWITGKRLKIDGYMLQCVWQALNPLSIHVTFTAIVPVAYPGEAKMWQEMC